MASGETSYAVEASSTATLSVDTVISTSMLNLIIDTSCNNNATNDVAAASEVPSVVITPSSPTRVRSPSSLPCPSTFPESPRPQIKLKHAIAGETLALIMKR